MGFWDDFGKGFIAGFTKPFSTTRKLIEGKNPLGDRGGRRRSTRKGQVRKTARRAYMGDRGGVRVKGYRRNGKRVKGHRRRKPRR
tara:strand:+ start:443 stop:697 length:255 start_codon:yes stop_codon:yes gene_type:complete